MRLNALPKTKNPHLSIVQFLKSLQINYLPDLRRCVSSEGAHYTDQKLSVKHLTTFFLLLLRAAPTIRATENKPLLGF